MAIVKEMWIEWREAPVTQLFLKDVETAANAAAEELLQRPTRDGDRDLYLRGVVQGLSLVAGWIPELVVEPGEKPKDTLKEEAR